MTHCVAWQGVELDVPEEWALTGFSGDAREGYMRVDSPGSLVAEVRWASARKAENLRKRLDTYLALVERQAKKRKAVFSARIEDDTAGVRFRYTADRKVYGIIRQCEQCKKVTISQVSGDDDDPVAGVSQPILRSVRCHTEDGWTRWAMLNSDFHLPKSYRLVKHKVMSGQLQLEYRHAYRKFVMTRWGLADRMLKRWDVPGWAQQVAGWRHFKGQSSEDHLWGHTVYKLNGRPVVSREWMRRVCMAPVVRHALTVESAVWHCDESNALYCVTSTGVDPDSFRMVLKRVACH